jgi:heme-degrading monooxygenase HmoA
MVDRPWTTVAPPEDREYLALVSYLPSKRFRTIPRFLSLAGAVAKQLEGTRGLVGFAFRAKILSRKFYTLSVWDDERALEEFVRREPHRGTMRTLGPHVAETKFARWTVRGPEVPPTWDKAMEVLRSQ